jgi:hypothetical protein
MLLKNLDEVMSTTGVDGTRNIGSILVLFRAQYPFLTGICMEDHAKLGIRLLFKNSNENEY